MEGLFVDGFVCEEKNFTFFALWHRQPVKVLKNRGDVVTGENR